MADSKPLGQRLIEAGLISPDQLSVALIEQKQTGKRLGETLVSLGFVTDEQAKHFIGEVTGFSFIDLDNIVPDPDALEMLDEREARTIPVFPVSFDGKSLSVALTEPDNIVMVDRLSRALMIKGHSVEVKAFGASREEIIKAIDRFYGHSVKIDSIISEIEEGGFEDLADDVGEDFAHPVVRLVDAILSDSIKQGASDIHFEPEESYVRLRYRIDGVLVQQRIFHKSLWSGISVRLKVLAGMDITDMRTPKDGRIELTVYGREVFFRVSTLPTIHGENFVLRVLDKDKGVVDLSKLGMSKEVEATLRQMISRPTGIMLVTGPTGSGKTTTLYSVLNERNDERVNIMTLEDPVEYPMQLIRQTQVKEESGLTFGAGVRAMLRQDPDIILVGEVRDEETADMAFKAAMTGHQVFATLHTNSAIGAIPRLSELGVKNTVMAGNIIGIVAQRLVRRLCEHCKIEVPIKPHLAQALGVDEDVTIYKACGCEHCRDGYKGRVAIMEALRFTPEMDSALMDGENWRRIEQIALESGFRAMAEDGLSKVLEGITTLEEVARVVDINVIRHARILRERHTGNRQESD